MDKAIAYFAPEAVGSSYDYFTDNHYYYQRIQGLGGLGALNGWLKRVFKKAKKAVRKVGRKVRKGLKKVGKVAKKVGKVAVKVIHKALPIVNTALTFIPGVGWAAKAVLTAAEIGLNAAMRAKKRRAQRKQMAKLNASKTTLVRKVQEVTQIKAVNPAVKRVATTQTVVSPPPVRRAPVYTAQDFMKINKAVAKSRISPAQIAAITRHKVNQSLNPILSF
jgi:hypothetical protein